MKISGMIRLAILAVMGMLLTAPALLAQAREDPLVRYPAEPRREQQVMKNLVGQVVDQNRNGLSRAVVHLKNKRTLEVKTRITDQEGNYVIRGLDRETDYEVHAEFQGESSDTKNVSSFDNRDEVYLMLEVVTSK